MIAAKHVVTDWNDIVKRARCSKEQDDERQGENNSSVIALQQRIECLHIYFSSFRSLLKKATQESPSEHQAVPIFRFEG
jgi:hypothetical protein